MVKPRLSWVLIAVGTIAFSPAPAIAQDSLDLSILNAGKTPSSPVTVSVVDDGRKVAVTRTDMSGDASIDFDMLNLGKGSPVEVKLVTRDGASEVILVPAGEVSDDCEDARRDDDDDCRTLGVVYWGETGMARIDVARGGSMTTGPTAVATRPVDTGIRMSDRSRIVVLGEFVNWTNLDDTACGTTGFDGCDADDSGFGFAAAYETGSLLKEKPLYLGIGGSYKSFGVTYDYGSLGTNKVDVDVFGIDAYLGYRLPLGDRATISPLWDFSWLFNMGDVETDFGTPVSESRDESGLRTGPGLDLDYGLGDRFFLRAGARYLFGDSDDADTHFGARIGFGLLF